MWHWTWVGVAAIIALASPAKAALTAQQALGKSLFFDATLSHSGNQSCGSCHSPASAFTDPDKTHATSKGDNPTLFGNRNAPSAMYMAYSPDFHFDPVEGLYVGGQFGDGRAATLEAQAKGPFLNPVEMGNASRADVVARLQSGANAAAFMTVYGTNVFDDVDVAYNNLAGAIAEYERSSELSPFTSKYDYSLKGQARLSWQEMRGLAAFNDPMKGNCAACHISTPGDDGSLPLFTDFTYDNIGSPKNWHSDFLSLDFQYNPDGAAFLDYGLGGVVGDDSLYGAFKVTTLRNIALTAPYGHNGWFTSLDQVVDFYATRDSKPVCVDPTVTATEAVTLGCWPAAEFDATKNADELGNLPLSKRDKADIVAFLNTLSDGYVPSSNVPEPASWAMMIAGFGMVGGVVGWRRRRNPQAI
ncbi:cytochrome c peroxidase [Polymorphobacter arshaanensis]|nr:cytochrome c peroxidase [Polymorphobacter arshaanensis]